MLFLCLGLILALALVDFLGRKKTLSALFALSAVSFLLLNICTSRLVIFLFILYIVVVATQLYNTDIPAQKSIIQIWFFFKRTIPLSPFIFKNKFVYVTFWLAYFWCRSLDLSQGGWIYLNFLTIYAPIPQNRQTHSSNLSAICWRIVWVCLTILWNWRLKY